MQLILHPQRKQRLIRVKLDYFSSGLGINIKLGLIQNHTSKVL